MRDAIVPTIRGRDAVISCIRQNRGQTLERRFMHTRWLTRNLEVSNGARGGSRLQSWGISYARRSGRWTAYERRDTRPFDREHGRLITDRHIFSSAADLVAFLVDGQRGVRSSALVEALRSMPEIERRVLAEALVAVPRRIDERAERLVSRRGEGVPVIGLPTSADPDAWVPESSEAWTMFDLLVGVPRDRPTEVWRLVINRTDTPYFGTGFRLGRVIPEDLEAGWVHGWMYLDKESVGVALTCDHRTSTHTARVLDLSGQGLDGMPELVEMVNEWWDELRVDDAAAYFASRLAPLALALVDAVSRGGTDPPAKVPPFSLLPRDPQWQPTPHDSMELIPMFYGVEDGEYVEWMPHQVALDESSDHGSFTVVGWGDIPGMDLAVIGWAAWPDGTVLATSRDDEYEPVPPFVNRVALPPSGEPVTDAEDRRIAFGRQLIFASSWLPQEW